MAGPARVAWNVLGRRRCLVVVRPIGEAVSRGSGRGRSAGRVGAVARDTSAPLPDIPTRETVTSSRERWAARGLHSVQVRTRARRCGSSRPAGGGRSSRRRGPGLPPGDRAAGRGELLSGTLDASAKADLLLGAGDSDRVLRIASGRSRFSGHWPPARRESRARRRGAHARRARRSWLRYASHSRAVTAARPARPRRGQLRSPSRSASASCPVGRGAWCRVDSPGLRASKTLADGQPRRELLADAYRHLPLEKDILALPQFEERAWIRSRRNEVALRAAGRGSGARGGPLELVPPRRGAGISHSVDPRGQPRRCCRDARRGEGRRVVGITAASIPVGQVRPRARRGS